MRTKSEVLHVLHRDDSGLTEAQIVKRLRPPGTLSFDEEVQHRTAVIRALSTLKHEHKAWPTSKAGLQRWNITDRGKRKY